MPRLSKNQNIKAKLNKLKERVSNPATQKVPKLEAKPTILTKEEKRKERKKQFLQKLEAAAESRNPNKQQLSLGDIKLSLAELETSQKELLAKLASNRESNKTGESTKPSNKGKQDDVVVSGPKKVSKVATSKSIAAETNQFALVLNHPAYQQDPFGTIQLHLQNTIKMQQDKAKH